MRMVAPVQPGRRKRKRVIGSSSRPSRAARPRFDHKGGEHHEGEQRGNQNLGAVGQTLSGSVGGGGRQQKHRPAPMPKIAPAVKRTSKRETLRRTQGFAVIRRSPRAMYMRRCDFNCPLRISLSVEPRASGRILPVGAERRNGGDCMGKRRRGRVAEDERMPGAGRRRWPARCSFRRDAFGRGAV